MDAWILRFSPPRWTTWNVRTCQPLMNQMIERKVACKRKAIAVTRANAELYKLAEPWECQGTTHWSRWDWFRPRWNGSLHKGKATGERKGAGLCVFVCVWVLREPKWDSVFTTVGVQKHKFGWAARRSDSATEIRSPRGSKLRKPPRGNFLHLSRLIHHGVIATSLLSFARGQRMIHGSGRIPHL